MSKLGTIIVAALIVLLVYPQETLGYRSLLEQEKFAELIEVEQKLQTSRETNHEDLPALNLFYKEVAGDYSLDSGQWEPTRRLLEKWRDEYPDADAPVLALAFHHYRYGWTIRGTGTINEVQQDNYKRFHQQMQTALTLAVQIEDTAQSNPAWWELILYIAITRNTPRATFDAVYNQAVSQFPFYLPYHISKAQFVSRRWHGSHAELAEFTLNAREELGRQFGGRLYARLQWNLRLNDMFDNGQAEWDLTEESLRAIIAEYPDRLNYIRFGRLACVAEDWSTVAEIIPKLDPPPTDDEWSENYYRYCKRTSERQARLLAMTVAEMEKIDDIDWTLESDGEQAGDIPAHVDEAIAALKGGGIEYARVKDTTIKLARENESIVRAMDKHGIRVLQTDFADVLFRLSLLDIEEAVRHLDRIPRQDSLLLPRIKKRYVERLEKQYPAWLWDYPELWEGKDVPMFVSDGHSITRIFEKIDTLSPHRRQPVTRSAISVLARLDAEPLLRYLDERGQEDLFRRALGHLVRNDAEKALVAVLQYNDKDNERLYDVLRDMAFETEAVIELMDAHGVTVPERELGHIVSSLAQKHPDKALTYADRLPSEWGGVANLVSQVYRLRLKEDYIPWVLDRGAYISVEDLPDLLERDDAETMAVLNDLPDSDYKYVLIDNAIAYLAKSDAARTMPFVELPDAQSDAKVRRRFTMIAEAAPIALRQWLSESGRAPAPTTVVILGTALMKHNVPDTYEWLEQFPPSDEIRALQLQLLADRARETPAEVAGLISGFADRPQALYVTRSLVTSWAGRDRDAAIHWVKALEDRRLKDMGWLGLSDQCAMTMMDFECALEFVSKIHDRETRLGAIFNLMPALYLKAPDKFDEVAEQYQLSLRDLARFVHEAEELQRRLEEGADTNP